MLRSVISEKYIQQILKKDKINQAKVVRKMLELRMDNRVLN